MRRTNTGIAPLRDASGDVMRAWAIVGVITIHAGDLTLPDRYFHLVSAYFRWAVPAFITLSAYFTTLSLSRQPPTPFSAFIKQRLFKLFIPFFVYSLMYFLLSADFNHLTPSSLLTRHFGGYGWAGQYFFIVMFQLLPVFFLLHRFTITPTILAGVIFLGLTLYLLAPFAFRSTPLLRQLGDRPFLFWLPYAFVGAYLAQARSRWLPWLCARVSRRWRLLAIVALPLVLSFSAAPIGHDSPYILPAVLGVSLALPPLFLSSFQAGCSAQVSFVGQHSLAIFCLNPLVIGMLRQSACFSAAPGEASGFTTIVLIFGIAGSCLIMASLLKRMGLKSLVA